MSYPKWPKIPRLSKINWSITEKIDGTNGIIEITSGVVEGGVICHDGDEIYTIRAGSRTRWLLPNELKKGGDNFGFAQWVWDNAATIKDALGEGIHYGEWWGQGIQRVYGQDTKRFSLFQPWRYPHLPFPVEQAATGHCVSRVPILQLGGDVASLAESLKLWDEALRRGGSVAAPGYMRPEGYVLQIADQRHKHIVYECGNKEASRG